MKIIITIEDHDDGVSVVSSPSFGEMMQSMMTEDPSPAMTYAMSMLNKAREQSKSAEKIPKPAKLSAVPDVENEPAS